MGPHPDEDRSAEPGGTRSAASISDHEAIEALRPPIDRPDEPGLEPPHRRHHHPGGRLTSWRMQLLLGTIAALLVWPLAAWDPLSDPVEVAVGGEVLERGASTSTSGTPPAATVAALETSTTTATAPPVEPVPAVTPPTTAPPRPRPSTTTSSSTTTTTVPPAKPAPVPPQSTSQLFPGVQLTLTTAAPSTGAVRTAEFGLAVEFGNARLLRTARFDFGDGTADDAPVLLWGCRDPAAPNPYVLSGPTHLYAAAGSYPVTITVRTAPCVLGTDDTLPEETAQMRLTVVVP